MFWLACLLELFQRKKEFFFVDNSLQLSFHFIYRNLVSNVKKVHLNKSFLLKSAIVTSIPKMQLQNFKNKILINVNLKVDVKFLHVFMISVQLEMNAFADPRYPHDHKQFPKQRLSRKDIINYWKMRHIETQNYIYSHFRIPLFLVIFWTSKWRLLKAGFFLEAHCFKMLEETHQKSELYS